MINDLNHIKNSIQTLADALYALQKTLEFQSQVIIDLNKRIEVLESGTVINRLKPFVPEEGGL